MSQNKEHPNLGERLVLRGIPIVVAYAGGDSDQCTLCAFGGRFNDCEVAEGGTALPRCYVYPGTYYEELK